MARILADEHRGHKRNGFASVLDLENVPFFVRYLFLHNILVSYNYQK